MSEPSLVERLREADEIDERHPLNGCQVVWSDGHFPCTCGYVELRQLRRDAASALSAAEERIKELEAYAVAQKDAAWELFDAAQGLVNDHRDTYPKLREAVESFYHDKQQYIALTIHDRLRRAEARLSLADKMAEAVEDVLRWDSAEAEPCWRCGGGGAYCEERLGALETCRCCEGRGSHCLVVQSKDGTVACVEHFPKKRGAECQSEPELYAALAAYRASEEKHG